MGYLRRLSQDKDDTSFISVVRSAMQRKISEGNRSVRSLTPNSTMNTSPQRKISSEVTAPTTSSKTHQQHEYIPLRPARKVKGKGHKDKEGNSSSTTTTTTAGIDGSRPIRYRKNAVPATQCKLSLPIIQRKISADNQISSSTSAAARVEPNSKKLAIPGPGRKSKSISYPSDHHHHSSEPQPERKLSESVSTYLVFLSEELKTALHPGGLHEPELIVGLSEILDIDDVLNISSMMNFGEPSWHLAYSTSLDRHSLKTLYKKIEQFQQINENGNLLIIMKDTRKHVFGALLTSRSKHCDFFDVYNHTTLFHCRPFRPFLCWLGEHKHVVRKYADAFYCGFKDVNCGLWLNESLKSGRIQEYDMNLGLVSSLSLRSTTENNIINLDHTVEPLEYSFQIKTLECWSFSYN